MGTSFEVSGLDRSPVFDFHDAVPQGRSKKCNEWLNDKKRIGNLFIGQTAAINMLAKKYKLPLKNGLPVLTDENLPSGNSTRVNFKDQWASHPSTQDRVNHLRALNIQATVAEDTAWVLFNNRQELEKNLTDKV